MQIDPSKPLKDLHLEVYAQKLALGRTQAAAFREAFPHKADWKAETIHNKASELAKRDEVRARRDYLVGQAAADTLVDAAYVLRMHKAHLEMDVLDLFDNYDDDSEPTFKPFSQWPDVWRKAIPARVAVELALIDPRSIEAQGPDGAYATALRFVKTPDRMNNLELLGKHVNVRAYVSTVTVGNPDGTPLATGHHVTLDPDKLDTDQKRALLAALTKPTGADDAADADA